jgi:hypothetical protein
MTRFAIFCQFYSNILIIKIETPLQKSPSNSSKKAKGNTRLQASTLASLQHHRQSQLGTLDT